MDRSANPLISRTATNVSTHCGVNVIIGRGALHSQKRNRRHHLSGLTVPARRNLLVDLGFLYCLPDPFLVSCFDCRDTSVDGTDRCHTRANGPTVDVNGTGTTERQSTAELGAREIEFVTEIPA